MNDYKIINLRVGEGYQSKFILCDFYNTENKEITISATLEYVLDNAQRREYNIVNSQEVLNFLNKIGRV